MRYVVIVAVFVEHFTTLVGTVVYKLVGSVIERHYRIKVIIFNAVVVPNLHDTQ